MGSRDSTLERKARALLRIPGSKLLVGLYQERGSPGGSLQESFLEEKYEVALEKRRDLLRACLASSL